MRKIGIAAITLFLVHFILPIPIMATSFHGIEILGEYQLPEELSIHFSDVCSGHSSFKQATAREDGWFAVCSLHTNTDSREQIYSLHYVDIYDNNGDFVGELSFSTDLDNAVELTDDSLIIYFQTFIVSYNLQSGEILSYSIPHRATVENGLLFELESDNFASGEWTYRSTGGWVNYTKLTRANDFESQVLLDYSSNDYISWFHVLRFVIILIITLTASLIFNNSKVKKR